MSTVTSLTYETLLAYVVPGSLIEVLVLALFWDDVEGLGANASAYPYVALTLLGLSVLLGLALNMWGTVATTRLCKLQEKRRNTIFFGEEGKPSILLRCLRARCPDTSKGDKIDLIYAIFSSTVSEHVYARRNWDWFYYQSSRNVLTACPAYVVGYLLVGLRYRWPMWFVMGGLVAIGLVLVVVCCFMLRQLEIYYGFYVSVVLGRMLEEWPGRCRVCAAEDEEAEGGGSAGA